MFGMQCGKLRRDNLDKEVLTQYCDLCDEVKEAEKRAQVIQKKIDKMIERRERVSDSVKGTRGDGTYGSIMVSGFPMKQYDDWVRELKKQKLIIEQRKMCAEKKRTEVEEFISTIDNSRIRRIIQYYYMDNLSWVQVAHRMNSGNKCRNTAESCRKASERYLSDEKPSE